MMKIGIDARFLTHPQVGGFKSYTENLIAALAEIDQENEYILYLDREPDPGSYIPHLSNFRTKVLPGWLPAIGMPWREQVLLNLQPGIDRVDVLHSLCLTAPLFLSIPSILTIHDLIWFHPERYSWGRAPSGKGILMSWYYHFICPRAAHRAARIITISNAAKTDIINGLKLPEDRVRVTYLAVNPIYKRVEDPEQLSAIRAKYGLPQSFILALGSTDPRKNILTLLKAYAGLPIAIRQAYQLLIVCSHPRVKDLLLGYVRELGLEGGVSFVERVSNNELVLIYNLASLFVFPSLAEGFGLPPLEAMACGVPVIAADNSSIPEALGDSAVYISAMDVPMITETIHRVLGDVSLRKQLIRKGLERAGTFSWIRCAKETLDVYAEVVRSGNRQ